MDIKVKSHLKPCAALSIAIMIVALVMTLTGHGMNLGVDFTGGTIMTYNMGEQFEAADVEAVLADNGASPTRRSPRPVITIRRCRSVSATRKIPTICVRRWKARSARNTLAWNMSIFPALARLRAVI